MTIKRKYIAAALMVLFAMVAWPVTASAETLPDAVQTDLREAMQNDFKDQLSFPLDEEKMIAYVLATQKVRLINDKWDVQIAGAESDMRAIEYNNFSVEEITDSLKSIPNLTLEQYNEMTRLVSANPSFGRLYNAYKDLVENKAIAIPPSLQSISKTAQSKLPAVAQPDPAAEPQQETDKTE